MTEHFTREQAVALASTIVDDDDYEFNLVNAAINAKQKEWEALGAVTTQGDKAYKRGFSDGMKEAPTGESWIRAIDEAMVGAHIGVAEMADDYGTAKKKLNALICWSVQVDRDLSRAQAAPAVGVPDGWIPVGARMPDSGQTVLALQTWDHSGKQSIIRASWVMAKTVESDEDSEIGEYDEATDTYYDPEGWYECISHWDEFTAVAVNGAKVTHWASLKPMLNLWMETSCIAG